MTPAILHAADQLRYAAKLCRNLADRYAAVSRPSDGHGELIEQLRVLEATWCEAAEGIDPTRETT